MANKTTQTTSPKTAPKLVLSRTFHATPERLWSFWTDPKKYATWFNPAPLDLVIHEFDLRVGGKIRFDMPQPDGNKNPQEGVFHVLTPHSQIVSGSPDKSFLMQVDFEPVGAKDTRMTVTMTGVPAEYHAMATQGWNAGFDKLEARLGGTKSTAAPSPGNAIQGLSPPATGKVTADRYVEVERWFKASPEKVFAAWGDKELLPKFFWPMGTGRVTELSFKPGGKLVMGHTDFADWKAHWEFLEIVPNRKIVLRDVWPDGSGVSATGTLEFIPEGNGTRLKVRHGPFPKTGPYQPEGAVQGFAIVADRLAEEVERPGAGDGFRLVRHFNAPPEKVYALWTTKEGLAKWWGPSANLMGYEFKVNQLDVRVGGAYDIQMSNKKQGELHNHGIYTEVIPNRKIAQRWEFDIFLAPGQKPYPISITVEFEPEPTMEPGKTGTKMTFTQGPMASQEFTEGSRQGVIQNLSYLAKTLA